MARFQQRQLKSGQWQRPSKLKPDMRWCQCASSLARPSTDSDSCLNLGLQDTNPRCKILVKFLAQKSWTQLANAKILTQKSWAQLAYVNPRSKIQGPWNFNPQKFTKAWTHTESKISGQDLPKYFWPKGLAKNLGSWVLGSHRLAERKISSPRPPQKSCILDSLAGFKISRPRTCQESWVLDLGLKLVDLPGLSKVKKNLRLPDLSLKSDLAGMLYHAIFSRKILNFKVVKVRRTLQIPCKTEKPRFRGGAVYIYIHIYIYIYFIDLFIYLFIYLFVCLFIYLFIFYTSVWMYVCMYVCMYLYVYIYIKSMRYPGTHVCMRTCMHVRVGVFIFSVFARVCRVVSLAGCGVARVAQVMYTNYRLYGNGGGNAYEYGRVPHAQYSTTLQKTLMSTNGTNHKHAVDVPVIAQQYLLRKSAFFDYS